MMRMRRMTFIIIVTSAPRNLLIGKNYKNTNYTVSKCLESSSAQSVTGDSNKNQSWNSILIFTTRKNPRSMFAMNTTNAMCTRNHMMNTSEEITLMAITDSCVTIVVRDSSTKGNSVSTGTLFI